MSTSIAVRGEVLPSLPELMERANKEHGLVEQHLNQALEHVIKCGAALNEARSQFDLEFKGWEKWVADNFSGGRVVASHYMRIAEHRELIQDMPNVSQALRRLRGMPALRQPGYRGYGEEMREAARVLARTGLSYADISRMLGPTRETIACWVDPAALRRHRERVRQQSKARRDKRRREKEEAKHRAAMREAKRVGGALAQSYSLVHKLEAPLALARKNATNPEIKALLDEAVENQHKTLYRIVDALGAS